jgi:hypothetical protein
MIPPGVLDTQPTGKQSFLNHIAGRPGWIYTMDHNPTYFGSINWATTRRRYWDEMFWEEVQSLKLTKGYVTWGIGFSIKMSRRIVCNESSSVPGIPF